MPNGCMCCRVRGDLVDALKRLILASASVDADCWPTSSEVKVDNNDTSAPVPASSDQQAKLDGIILECSGLDELAPILQVALPLKQARSPLELT